MATFENANDAFESVTKKETHYVSELVEAVLEGAQLNLSRLEQIEEAEWTRWYWYGRFSVSEYIATMRAAEAAPDISSERLVEAAERLRPRVWLKEGEDAAALAPEFKRWGGGFKLKDVWLHFDHSNGHYGEIPRDLTFDHGRLGDLSAFELFDDREAAIHEAFKCVSYGDMLKLRDWKGYSEVTKVLGINPYPSSGREMLIVPARGLTRDRVKEAVRRDGRCFKMRVDCDRRGMGKDGKSIPIDNISKWLFGVPGRDGRGNIWVDGEGIHLPENTPQECIDLLREVIAKMK